MFKVNNYVKPVNKYVKPGSGTFIVNFEHILQLLLVLLLLTVNK